VIGGAPSSLAYTVALADCNVLSRKGCRGNLRRGVQGCDSFEMLRALFLTALAAPGAALLLAAPKPAFTPAITGRARPIVAVSSLENTEQPEFITTLTDVGITALRLGTCALMIHHGFDKIQNVDGFSANVVAKFFGFLPGPPQFWTLSAAATQIAGAVLLSLGVCSRPVALSMSATMITAVVFHLLNTGPEAFPLGVPKAHSYNFELAAMYVFVLGYFSVAGAGKYSVDEQVLGGELNFYSGLLDKAFNKEEE
jgi:putative oxidoreductase